MWTETERRAVALGGSSIHERIRSERTGAVGAGVDAALAERRWQDWLESATAGDTAAFTRAFRGERIDERVARLALGRTTYPENQPLPSWVEIAAWLIDAATGPLAPPSPEYGAPVPFDPIVRAMAEAMVRRVESATRGVTGDAWRPSARAGLCRRFAADLAELLAFERACLERGEEEPP